MTLLARVEFMEDELTQASFLERLATISGCPSAASFCRDFGLGYTAIRQGQRDQLARLAEIAGANAEQVFANAIKEVGPRSFELRGCRVISNMLRTDEVALCPACIKEDLAAGATRRNPYDIVYYRIAWHLRAIETCTTHHCRLERFALNERRYDRRSFTIFGWDAAYQLQSGSQQEVFQEPSGLEMYVHGRLHGLAAGNWLDDMPLSEVTRLCEGFGELIVNGEAREQLRETRSSDRREIRNEGFRLLRGGPEELHVFLAATLAALRKRKKDVGVTNLLGSSLRELLHRRDEATTDFRLFRQEVERFVWQELPERFVQRAMPNLLGPLRLDELASRTRIPAEHALAVVERLGLEPDEHDRFAPVTARVIAREATKLWTVKRVRQMLGTSYEGLWCLADAGVLGFVRRNSSAKAKRKFEAEAVIGFLASLKAAARFAAGSPDWITPGEAAMRYRCGLQMPINMVLSGSMQNVAYDDRLDGLDAVRFCEKEFFMILVGVPWFGLPMRKAADRLEVSFEVLAGLVREGYLEAHRYEHSTNSPVFVSEDSLREFEHRYVPSTSLAKAYGKTSRGLISHLAKKGVHPAILRSRCGAHFYLRAGLST